MVQSIPSDDWSEPVEVVDPEPSGGPLTPEPELAPEIGYEPPTHGPAAPMPVEQSSPQADEVQPAGATMPADSSDHAAANDEIELSERDAIAEFVSAHTNVVGSREVLDRLPDKSAAAEVREQLLDVIESEGPIEVGRLARIVGRRFNLGAVRQARADEITKLIPRTQLRKSRRFGNFAWPAELDPESWIGFRTADANGSRSLDEVAPEEIANAMLEIMEQNPDLEYVDDVLRGTAEIFGIVRLGAGVRARLEAVYNSLAAEETPEIPSG